jgi:hypothetical protein
MESDALTPPPPAFAEPRHPWHSETTQYRVKLQTFSRLPEEVTVQRISFDREFDAYHRAWENGQSSCFRRRRLPDPSRVQDPEAQERAQRRAKTRVRLLVTELAPEALVTFTTRDILSLEQLLAAWQHFTRLLRLSGLDYEYVAVPERHPSNPDHLHLHVAYRGETNFSTLRRLWHISLEALHGRKVRTILRGAQSPGNIDVQKIKARDQLRRIRKIARYVSKYITKDLISAFNQKRYWPSKGIDLQAARVYWLTSLDPVDAIKEACILMGQWDHVTDTPGQKLFNPSERICWFSVDPERTPPPF